MARPAVYVGPIEHLKGRGALIMPSQFVGYVMVQFNEMNLTREMVHPTPARFDGPWPEGSLGLGWHRFSANDFEVTK